MRFLIGVTLPAFVVVMLMVKPVVGCVVTVEILQSDVAGMKEKLGAQHPDTRQQ